MIPFDDHIEESLLQIKEYELPVTISYSGGKDSSAVMGLFFIAIARDYLKPTDVSVVFADTRMEAPNMNKQIEVAKLECDRLGISFTRASSPLEKSFFVRIFSGVAIPNRRFRWCTEGLKIKPFKGASTGKTVSGVRYNESVARDKRLKAGECGKNECGAKETYKDLDSYAPIKLWKSCQVWDFITISNVHGFFSDRFTTGLQEMYSVNGRVEESLRTGCMGCPLITKDRSLNAFIDHESGRGQGYEPLRQLHSIYQSLTKAERRVLRPGFDYPGAIKLSVRKKLFTRLIAIEAKVKQAHPDFILIDEAEKGLIREYLKEGKYPSNYPKGFTE